MDFIGPLYAYLPGLGIVWLIVSAIFASILAAALSMLVKKERLSRHQAIAIEILSVYLFLVLASTVFSRDRTVGFHYKLMPFWSYVAILRGATYYIQENIYNVLMLMPIGFLLPICCKEITSRQTIVFGFCFSLGIEVLQLILKAGLFEFDDMVHNTVGVIIGVQIHRGLLYLSHQKR